MLRLTHLTVVLHRGRKLTQQLLFIIRTLLSANLYPNGVHFEMLLPECIYLQSVLRFKLQEERAYCSKYLTSRKVCFYEGLHKSRGVNITMSDKVSIAAVR